MVVNNYTTSKKLERWDHMIRHSPLKQSAGTRELPLFTPKPYRITPKSTKDIMREQNFINDSVKATKQARAARQPLNPEYDGSKDKMTRSFSMSPVRQQLPRSESTFRMYQDSTSSYNPSEYSLPPSRCVSRKSSRSTPSCRSILCSRSLVSRGVLRPQTVQEIESKERLYHNRAVKDTNSVRWWNPTTYLIQPYDAVMDPNAGRYFSRPEVKKLKSVSHPYHGNLGD
ncbi:Oidioi.mRNA.OKI2018_I69.PAR.g12963.t1.cds [Oikopleura dioica]|uniref:Oidioi.mRNA.OKI2018_I69.PAR.g12963.t1.cds n=1 Tax=Oikopleura dioica TaxID=34765 RepID=A0ABN7S9F8_OIKDI|nr:Oidioi.mRNA.OKI2018_I69.PAR.g12963.t1.cds [Oikopleura dioica]